MLFNVVAWAKNYEEYVLPKKPILFNVTKWAANYEKCILAPRRLDMELKRLRRIEMQRERERRVIKDLQARRLKKRLIQKENEEIRCLQMVKAETREVPVRFYRGSPSGSSFELDECCASRDDMSVAPSASWIAAFGSRAVSNISEREKDIRLRSRDANSLFFCLGDNVDDGYFSD